MQKELETYINRSPRILKGKPYLRGTRIPVEQVVREIARGASVDDLLASYPKLTKQSIHAALDFAADAIMFL